MLDFGMFRAVLVKIGTKTQVPIFFGSTLKSIRPILNFENKIGAYRIPGPWANGLLDPSPPAPYNLVRISDPLVVRKLRLALGGGGF